MQLFCVFLCILEESGGTTSESGQVAHNIVRISLFYASVESGFYWSVLHPGDVTGLLYQALTLATDMSFSTSRIYRTPGNAEFGGS